MEIVNNKIDENITQINIGLDFDETTKEVTGEIELDIENQSYFVETLESILNNNISNIVVNLSNVSYIDSSGLWAIFEGHKKAQNLNGNLVLLNPNKDVERVLEITKLSSKLKIFTSIEEAKNSFFVPN